MKLFRLFLILLTSCIMMAASCKKDKESPEDELAKLPPETQTGANTFGALVNGKAFLPGGAPLFGPPAKQCSYNMIDGGYYLSLGASKENSSGTDDAIYIHTYNLPIQQGKSTLLTDYFTSGKASGSFIQFARTSENIFRTNATITGELHITRLDMQQQIMSGTFWFDGINKNGEKVEIRNGRFDMRFTK